MNTQFPTIESFVTRDSFKYLWLKYVNGFDLSVHCAKCLLGTYSKKITTGAGVALSNVTLDESFGNYYYLCGVTTPFRWRDNLHIAFKYKQGGRIVYDDGRTRVVIRDAEQIAILDLADYSLEPAGNQLAYNTCRNWRFAYQIKHGIKYGKRF